MDARMNAKIIIFGIKYFSDIFQGQVYREGWERQMLFLKP